MICDDFNFFPREGRLLGVDWGEKRIGLAVSDPAREFVFIRPQISNSEFRNKIPDLIEFEDIAGIVVGLPLRLNGDESGTTRRARDFADELARLTDAPIVLFDEALTSAEASDRGAKPGDLDSESARVLLENAIAVMKRA
jgi:putative Holliday junction resolvase